MRYPERLSVPLATELVRGANAPGFLPAFDALMRYSFRDRLEKIEVPALIVWGRNDMLVPVEDAEMYEHLIGENAHARDLRGHRAPAMVERPSRFNELLRGVHRRGPGAAGKVTRRRGASARDGAQRGARDQLRVLGQHAGA